MQRLTCALWALFQSSLNLLAGCSWHFVIGLDQGCCSFNSHPTSRLGAGGGDHSSSLFQSSPNLLGWAQVCRRFNPHLTSRPGAALGLSLIRFQSSLNLWVGRSNRGPRSGVPAGMFQSSPNLSVGCSLHCQVQPVARIDSFQSSPNLSVECSLITAGGVFTPFWFQSSLNLLVGRSLSVSRRLPVLHLFQSSSNLLVGRSLSVSPVLPLFQSSLNLLAGCRWRRSYSLCVSILTQPLGWVQCHNLCQFQSSPNLSAGCSATPVAG